MKLYLVTTTYPHRGTGYDRTDVQRIFATSLSAALGRAARGLRKAKHFKFPVEATLRIKITNLGDAEEKREGGHVGTSGHPSPE